MSWKQTRRVGGAAFGLTMALAATAAAETVVVVPYAQQNPDIPHPAHSNAPITLKAMVRGLNAGCATYNVVWDTDLNNQFNEAATAYARTGSTLWDIGKTFTVPAVARDQRMNVQVRVQCATDASLQATGTYKLYVYAWTPSNDPQQWTTQQVETMSIMAVEESMWRMYRRMNFLDGAGDIGRAGSNIRGLYGDSHRPFDGLALWAMAINGHLAAYPPNSVNWGAVAAPAGWVDANNARWNNDPYAEATLRWANDLLDTSGLTGVDAVDEADTCGLNANGTDAACPAPAPIAGTNDSRGLYFAGDGGTYATGMTLGGMSALLPSLAGVPVQRGPAGISGQKYEWVIQQAADYLGWMQIDSGNDMGGWYYSNGGINDGSTTQWALVGMEGADVAGRPFGVVVNNRHKYRVSQNVYWSHDANGAACYAKTYGYCNNFMLTGGAILGARWLGIHQMANDGTQPWPNYWSGTRAQLLAAYQGYVNHVAANWTRSNYTSDIGHLTNLWLNGSYLCGNTSQAYNTNNNDALRCGNTYAMYSHQKGYRTGSPGLAFAGRDWEREFSIYYVRAQDRAVGDYANFGRVYDSNCAGASIACNYTGVAGHFGTPVGSLIMTPTIFNPKPVAVARVNGDVSATTVEGCMGGNNGQVTFTHNESFHPNPSASILLYQWDVDTSNGLWWTTGAAPDFQTADPATSFTYRYLRAGTFTATLRVVDNGVGASQQTDTRTVTVTVNAGANVAPAAATGGPYVIEVNSNLQLAGTANDLNVACGQTITTAWDLNNANTWTAANAANGLIPWASLSGFATGQAIPLRMRVTDAAGASSIDATTVTIYPAAPVAVGAANPAQAACNQDVVLSGAGSYHPNPRRSIAQYHWDPDGDGDFDGGGQSPTFTWRYAAYGTYTVTLRVTDDLGRTATTTFQVRVNQGNQPPVARTSAAGYTVLEGDALTLDATLSSDANSACGDSIAAYAWDINGDGDYVDAVDLTGQKPVVPWATLNTLRKFADPATGLPTNTITLRVTDTFGAQATVNATITIYQAAPIAVVVQSPDPAPINLVTGFSDPTLNAQESRSPIPGMALASFDWDLDDNGTFEVLNRPAVVLQRIYLPVPAPNALPQVFVRMRVTDTAGRQGQTRYQVRYRVPPTPPTADADPTDPPERNYHILLGQGVALDPRQSFDPDTRDFGDYIKTYRWDVNANVNAPVWDRTVADNGSRQNVVVNLTAQQLAGMGVNAPGTYTILLEVVDTTDLTNRDTATLYVYAANPVAVASANPNPAACGDRVTLDGSRSDHPHPNINVVGWAWDLDNDGQYDDAQGVSVVQAFNAFTFGGPAHIGLQVTDSAGATGTSSVDVAVTQGNRPPVAAPGGPYTIVRNDGVTLRGQASADPDAACGDAIVEYAWDIRNDGTFDIVGANASQPALTWGQLNGYGINGVGGYVVALRVKDRFGVTSTSTVALNVINGPTAVAVAVPNSVACNGEVDFDGSASRTDAPAGDATLALTAWEWDFNGDGVYETSGRTVHRAISGQGGTVSVPFRVTDAAGHTATTTVVVNLNVQNLAPVANAGGPYATGRVGASFAGVTLDGRGSADPNAPCDSIARYKWDTDNDGLYGTDDLSVTGGPGGKDYEGATVAGYVNANWVVGGQYIVRLVVCDNKVPQLCSQPAEAVINVRNEAPPVGEITSPRATDTTFCAGANPFNVTFSVADPEGDRVNVTVKVGGVVVAGPTGFNTNANGTPVQGTIQVNPAAVAEGSRTLELFFDDSQGGTATVNAGGTILFDRTAPSVTIGNTLGADVCYPTNQIPAPQITVTDTGDPAPNVAQSTTTNGCGRTLTVTATDRCGNAGSVSRAYRVAEAVQVTINGAAEGALVSQAQMTWAIQGPANCANNITSTLARNGAAGAAYVQNTVINQAGSYVLNLAVANCANVSRDVQRSFVVNAAPVPDAIPVGHTATDPAGPAGVPSYIVAEGAGLQVDATESRPPENGDSITGYRWDFKGDGTWDSPAGGGYAAVATAAYPTNDNGKFTGKLEVKDSLNATAQQSFQVTVTDVNPTARPGGPYATEQGTDLLLDGSGSTAGHPVADPIATYKWDFGDGSAVESGPPATHAQRHHTYAANGVYNVTLTVIDEDSQHSATAVVTVRDVDPVLQSVTLPNPAYEIANMTFTVAAAAGAPGDPIQTVEWDFNGDGQPERTGPWPGMATTTWAFEDEGTYTVTVKLIDRDSSITQGQQLRIRRITMDELLTVAQQRITALRNAVPAPAQLVLAPVAGTDTFINNGHWGEGHNRRGNTWQALDQITYDIAQSQAAGGSFGNLLWALSRTFVREIDTFHDAAALNPRDAVARASLTKAESYITRIHATYAAAGYRAAVSGANGAIQVRDLSADVNSAYFYLADSLDPFNRFNLFPMPAIADIQTRVRLANDVNANLVTALTELKADLTAYAAEGAPASFGPGRATIQNALGILNNIMPLMAKRIGIVCDVEGQCITDYEALRNELLLMDLINTLYIAQAQGVWVRNWQKDLMLAVKFRIELSLLRVEFVCGKFSPIAIQARTTQATGLTAIANYQYEAALAHYIKTSTYCTILRTYNTCLVPAARNAQTTPFQIYPATCPDDVASNPR